jgi:hypothetical protein
LEEWFLWRLGSEEQFREWFLWRSGPEEQLRLLLSFQGRRELPDERMKEPLLECSSSSSSWRWGSSGLFCGGQLGLWSQFRWRRSWSL